MKFLSGVGAVCLLAGAVCAQEAQEAAGEAAPVEAPAAAAAAEVMRSRGGAGSSGGPPCGRPWPAGTYRRRRRG
jgi:hypothetical protein